MAQTIVHLQRLMSYGVSFHSYTEPHLPTDNELVRNILLALLSSLAKVEALKISEQTQENWSVLILDHHEGYISWAEYERNMEVIAHNAGNKGLMVRRAVRPGAALLSGLLRCGHCGRKMQVSYAKGTHRYFSVGADQADGAGPCTST